MDLAYEISKKAERVTLSHHHDPNPKTVFPSNVDQRPDIKRLTEDGAEFADGSTQTYSVIFYCTGELIDISFREWHNRWSISWLTHSTLQAINIHSHSWASTAVYPLMTITCNHYLSIVWTLIDQRWRWLVCHFMYALRKCLIYRWVRKRARNAFVLLCNWISLISIFNHNLSIACLPGPFCYAIFERSQTVAIEARNVGRHGSRYAETLAERIQEASSTHDGHRSGMQWKTNQHPTQEF